MHDILVESRSLESAALKEVCVVSSSINSRLRPSEHLPAQPTNLLYTATYMLRYKNTLFYSHQIDMAHDRAENDKK